jgi:hypothetical protein
MAARLDGYARSMHSATPMGIGFADRPRGLCVVTIATTCRLTGRATPSLGSSCSTQTTHLREVASPLAGPPYDLRHAALTLWLNAGVPAAEVAERTGNSAEVLRKHRSALCFHWISRGRPRQSDLRTQSRVAGAIAITPNLRVNCRNAQIRTLDDWLRARMLTSWVHQVRPAGCTRFRMSLAPPSFESDEVIQFVVTGSNCQALWMGAAPIQR